MRLVWTGNARNKLAEILDYIEKEFGSTAREQFRKKAKEFTVLLRKFPEIGTLEIPEKNVRGFQLSHQTRLFYRLKGDKIIILTLFDSRQDPGKKPQ